MEEVFSIILKKIFIALCCISLLNSCSRLTPSVYVLLGNYRYEQGRYQEAVVCYFKALEKAQDPDPVYYNLGVAYYALGESESAIRMWENINLHTNTKIKGVATFNKGVIYYQLGRYLEATEQFHYAMKALPENFETKVNLELTLKKRRENFAKNTAEETTQTALTKEQQQTTQRTLDYLRRRKLYFRGSMQGEDVWQQEVNDW